MDALLGVYIHVCIDVCIVNQAQISQYFDLPSGREVEGNKL